MARNWSANSTSQSTIKANVHLLSQCALATARTWRSSGRPVINPSVGTLPECARRDDNSTLKYLISHAHVYVSLHWDKIEDSVQARPETMDGYMNKMW